MGALKSEPDEVRLGCAGWTISIPRSSYFLPRPNHLKRQRTAGQLIVSEVTVSPDDRYCFTVLKDDGHPVVTFSFMSLDDAAIAVREMKALLPHIVQNLTWRK